MNTMTLRSKLLSARKLAAGLLVLLAGLQADAGTVSADMRFDYRSTSYNDDAKTTAKTGLSQFYLQTGRVDFKGNLNEDVAYRLRLRFNRDRATTTRDGVGTDTDFAYITNKLGDGFSVTLGKFASSVGGFEANTSGADLYLNSVAYEGSTFFSASTTPTTLGLKNVLYYSGLQLAYSFAETQQVQLHMVNLDANVGPSYNATATGTSGDVANQNKAMTAVVYRGGFLDKTLNLLASYHFQDVGDKDNKVSLGAAGIEYVMDSWVAQFDFLLNNYEKTTGTVVNKNTLNTNVLSLRYKMDQWSPIVKYAYSEEKIGGVATDVKNKYDEYGAAVEYTPKNDQVFRYHLAYNMRSGRSDATGARSPSSTEVIVGTRILADFLK